MEPVSSWQHRILREKKIDAAYFLLLETPGLPACYLLREVEEVLQANGTVCGEDGDAQFG